MSISDRAISLQADQARVFTPAYRLYVLLLLFLIYTTNVADRQILGLLIPLIKEEFVLSDTLLGFLGGAAFAVFYATLGIPIAILADRKSRKVILITALSVWSVMTALCGLAQNFWHLALARVGVGVGEAGGGPPSQAMIADLYPPQCRATALSVFSMASATGLFVGYMVGGQVAFEHGWRAAFLVLGIPGLLLAALALLTLREPPRGLSDQRIASEDAPVSFFTTLAFMWSQKALRHVIIGATLVTFAGYASVQWTPAFLVRSHGMQLTEISVYLAVALGVAGALGTLSGGWLSDWLGRRDVRWGSWVVAVVVALGLPLSLAIGLIDNSDIVRGLVPVAFLVNTLYLGPTLAMTQGLVSIRMRAVAASVLLLCANLIGMGLGPLFAGALSDALAARYGTDSLRYALMVLGLFSVWAAIHYTLAGFHLQENIRAAVGWVGRASGTVDVSRG
jgi:MFS family permease